MGTGISDAATWMLGSTEASLEPAATKALGGAGSSGAVAVGAHVEQHIEAWTQSPAGTLAPS